MVLDPRPTDLEGLEGDLFAMILGVHRAARDGTTFERVRARIPRCGVQTAGVVPRFRIFKDGHACFGPGLERTPVDEPAFERGEEVLGHRIVIAVASRAGRRHHCGLPAPFAEGQRGVLSPLDALIRSRCRSRSEPQPVAPGWPTSQGNDISVDQNAGQATRRRTTPLAQIESISVRIRSPCGSPGQPAAAQTRCKLTQNSVKWI